MLLPSEREASKIHILLARTNAGSKTAPADLLYNAQNMNYSQDVITSVSEWVSVASESGTVTIW